MTAPRPLVSVVVTTRNSADFLGRCLQSIRAQTYGAIESIVVDNGSTDATKEIAMRLADRVLDTGPERSAQRNLGAGAAAGQYLLIVDSDMELTPRVVEACVERVTADPAVKALIIPEESFGVGFWAQCKKLERSFYVGVDWIEAARFFSRGVYEEAGGYDLDLTGPEDWELSQRVGRRHRVERVDELILHNEGRLSLRKSLRKKYLYARTARAYLAGSGDGSALRHPAGPLARYRLFMSQPGRLLRHPIVGLGMLLMKTGEYGMGYLASARRGRGLTP
jgi:glycosyltransferase involved in cell wall biosynthesis